MRSRKPWVSKHLRTYHHSAPKVPAHYSWTSCPPSSSPSKGSYSRGTGGNREA